MPGPPGNSAVLGSHRLLLQEKIADFLTVRSVVQSIIALMLADSSDLALLSKDCRGEL